MKTAFILKKNLLWMLAAAFGVSGLFALPFAALARENMLSVGDAAPHFALPDVQTGQTVSLEDFSDKKALLVMILCRHCPYVQHVKDGIAAFARDYADRDIALVAISSNDVEAYPVDRPESLRAMAEEAGYTFPFLYDESQAVAKAYTAVATPDFLLFDENRKLVYRGQFDDSRPFGKEPVTGGDLRTAVDALLEGRPVPDEQHPAVGCSIKWKAGNRPSYV